MSIRILTATLIALTLGTTSLAQAEDFPFRVGLEGSFDKPMGDFADIADNGNQFGVTFEKQMSPMISLGASVGRHAWDANDEFNTSLSILLSMALDPTYDPFVDPLLVSATTKFDAIQYTGHARFYIPTGDAQILPYLQAGVGGYRVKTTVDVAGLVSTDDSKNYIGFQIGGGVGFQVTPNARLGVHALYHYMPTEDDLGGNITTTSLGADLSFGFGR